MSMSKWEMGHLKWIVNRQHVYNINCHQRHGKFMQVSVYDKEYENRAVLTKDLKIAPFVVICFRNNQHQMPGFLIKCRRSTCGGKGWKMYFYDQVKSYPTLRTFLKFQVSTQVISAQRAASVVCLVSNASPAARDFRTALTRTRAPPTPLSTWSVSGAAPSGPTCARVATSTPVLARASTRRSWVDDVSRDVPRDAPTP